MTVVQMWPHQSVAVVWKIFCMRRTACNSYSFSFGSSARLLVGMNHIISGDDTAEGSRLTEGKRVFADSRIFVLPWSEQRRRRVLEDGGMFTDDWRGKFSCPKIETGQKPFVDK